MWEVQVRTDGQGEGDVEDEGDVGDVESSSGNICMRMKVESYVSLPKATRAARI